MSYPVSDLKESIAYYRDNFGFEEAWREGELTAALKLEGTNVNLMLDQEDDGGPGGVFLVDSVDAFYEAHKDRVQFVREPFDIPPGRYAMFKDNSGNPVRLIDMTKEREV